MLTRILFACIAVAAVVGMFQESPSGWPHSDLLEKRIALAGIAVLGLGMAVPWGYWIHMTPPRGDFGFVSKWLGWSGVGLLPLLLLGGEWEAACIVLLVSCSALALWTGRKWAAWPWYVIGLGALLLTLPAAYPLVLEVRVDSGWGWVDYALYLVAVAWLTFWLAVAWIVLRGVTRWRSRPPTPVGDA